MLPIPGDIIRLQPNLVCPSRLSDPVFCFCFNPLGGRTAALCKSARVQRDIQCEEQVEQGHCRVWRVRHGSVFGVLYQVRRRQAATGRAQPDVLPIVDSQDARLVTGTG
jgi:hypothetical protein